VVTINLTGVEAYLAGVPSETPDMDTTTLPSSSGRASLEPETLLLKKEFLLNGKRTFASGLVALAVAELIGDLCENLLLNDCDMCDIIEPKCSYFCY
jgi:hypothetical protein